MLFDDILYRMLYSHDYQDPKIADVFRAIEPELTLVGKRMEEEQKLLLVQYADEAHIKRWEDSIQVNPAPSDLEQRRRYLQTLLVTKIKVGANSLSALIKQFTGADNKVTFADSTITVTLFNGISQSLMHQFELLLKQIIPAHLYYAIILDYDLKANLNLANYKSSWMELEVTDQYDRQINVNARAYGLAGSLSNTALVKFSDQYDEIMNITSQSDVASGYVQSVEIEVSDQNDSIHNITGDGSQANTIGSVQVFYID